MDHPHDGAVIYRGQSRPGSLLPSIARHMPNWNSTDIEKRMIVKLRQIGAAHISAKESDWEVLVKAQHYGLKTRLLDWTSNPLAALWFACNGVLSHNRQYTYIYMLDTRELDMQPDLQKGPWDQEKTRVYRPHLNNPRVIAQNGYFTVHQYSEHFGKFLSLDHAPDVYAKITEFKIPKDCVRGIMASLSYLGIGAASLYPDLQGVCNAINQQFLYDLDCNG
ncbi:FRG domain-containing protein [Pseudovibrio sp. SPO723]|uniref:FRG domain-containing protein n=1 Tax=Nesiotobacter zosterae TaxID=392721 RepID=UPI0029C48F50|nr:FRG domain-containing protein [Pseudovibrio sp. SPO723]MDX5593788.1 FRG domain-containing protein [Pseudovibrio sp. SPO723]